MTQPASHQTSRVFRVPLATRLGAVVAIVFGAILPLLMMAFTLLAFLRVGWEIGLFTLALTAFVTGLALYMLRDVRGKLGLRINLDADSVTLHLPSGRSLIHRPPSQHLTVPYADIAAIETRLEAYRTLGMAMVQRAYVLRRHGGELIFLFEERALATGFASSMFGGIAHDIAARAGVPVTDFGMAEGRGGLLGVWDTHAPDWAAPALSPERQRSLWARAAATGGMAAAAVSAVTGTWLGGIGRRRPGSEPPSH